MQDIHVVSNVTKGGCQCLSGIPEMLGRHIMLLG